MPLPLVTNNNWLQQLLIRASIRRDKLFLISKLPFKTQITWRPEEEDDCCQWSGVRCNNQTGHVTELDFGGYGLGGEISLSLVNLTYLTSLTYLNFQWNNFNGTIPISIVSLTSLTRLDLSGNKFSGVIPQSIGSLTKLTWLKLSDNFFYGTIPREFGNLTNLESLYLYSLGSCRVENIDWLSSLSSLEDLEMDGTS
ncbi:leucine-rich repeat-containing protein, partial [Tanacetum coccineum]